MSELAQDIFSFVRHPEREERASSEKKRRVESLTKVGSFQGHGVRTTQEERVAPRGTLTYGSDLFARGETATLSAPLGLTRELITLDIEAPPFQGERMVALASREISALIVTDLQLPHLQRKQVVASVLCEIGLGTDFFSVIQSEPPKAQRQRVALDITDEANRRLASHEDLKEQLVSIVEESALELNVPLKRIAVRPGWSHEYEDTTSVVIDVEIEGTDNQRFSLWDVTCEKIDELRDLLPVEEVHFLTNEISIVVGRD